MASEEDHDQHHQHLSDDGEAQNESQNDAEVETSPESRHFLVNTMVYLSTNIFLLCVILFSPISIFPDATDILPLLGLASAPLSTRLAKNPEPFFENPRWVDDFYGGDVFEAFAFAHDYDRDAFIMYYAPWDVDSARAREILDRVGDIFEDHLDIYFAAVNCWTSAGACHKEFGDGRTGNAKEDKGLLQLFPDFVYYPRDRRGIHYNGPITVHDITQFLLNAYEPLKVLTSKRDLVKLKKSSGGNVLIGFMPKLSPSALSLNYRRFLKASYDMLEIDPLRSEVAPLAVVTSESLAFHLQLNHQTPIRLFSWNGTSIAYPNMTINSASSLVKWARTSDIVRDKKLTSWTGTKGRKSLNIAQRLQFGSGNSLLAFFPKSLDHFCNEDLSTLRKVAMEYFFCNESGTNGNLRGTFERRKRHWTDDEHNEHEEDLESLYAECKADSFFFKHICSVFERSPMCDVSYNETLSRTPKVSSFGRGDPKIGSTAYFDTDDPNVASIQVRKRRLNCALLASSDIKCKARTLNENLESEEIMLNHFGLGCTDNKTLNFYTVDAVTQTELARSIGLTLRDDSASIIIVDTTNELVYKMKEILNLESLSQFLQDFHHHPENLDRLAIEAKIPTQAKSSPQQVFIEEINLSNFYEKVMNPSKNVVLLYHSVSCGMCASYAYVFHTVQTIFTDVHNVTFVSVDAGRNDLPWHFTALSVPSVIFFPAGSEDRKAESRAFPSNRALNVTNLVNFIMANLDKKSRLNILETLCDDDCKVKVKSDDQSKHFDDLISSLPHIIPPNDEEMTSPVHTEL